MLDNLYKKRAKILRKMGVVNLDLRFSLTPQQKSAITRTWNKNKSVANNLQDYAIKIVSNKTAKSIDADKVRVKLKNGKTRLFIPAQGQHVTIKKGRVVLESKSFKETIFPVDKNIFKTAGKLLDKIKRGEYLTVKIGSNAMFSTVFTDIKSFERYLANWSPKDKPTKKHKNDLISQMSLVVAKGQHPQKISGGKKWQERKDLR